MRKLYWLGLSVLLVGCGSEDHQDLDRYLANAVKSEEHQISPLPIFKPVATFNYSANHLRSPFAPALPLQNAKQELQRPKEILENYPLDALRVVGTLRGDKRYWALVAIPDGTVYQVTVGHHIGQNLGQITAISEQKLNIMEMIPDSKNGWTKRSISLMITSEQ